MRAHLQRAAAALEARDANTAIREARQALDVDESSIEAMLALAHGYYLKQYDDKAEAILEVARKQKAGAEHPVLWMLLGLIFDRAGTRDAEALAAYEKATAIKGDYLAAWINRGVIYLAKLASNLVLILAVAAIVTPAGVLFFGFDLSQAPGTFAGVMSLSILGFAAVGTLFAAMASSTRLQGGFLAMMIFPITLPLVLVSTQLLMRVFRDGQSLSGGAIGILVAFDVIFLVVSWIAFEWILEP